MFGSHFEDFFGSFCCVSGLNLLLILVLRYQSTSTTDAFLKLKSKPISMLLACHACIKDGFYTQIKCTVTYL